MIMSKAWWYCFACHTTTEGVDGKLMCDCGSDDIRPVGYVTGTQRHDPLPPRVLKLPVFPA